MYVIGDSPVLNSFCTGEPEEYFKNPNKSTDINGGRKMAPFQVCFLKNLKNKTGYQNRGYLQSWKWADL